MENWKEIKGYEGLYSVSDKGNIMSHNYLGKGISKILVQRIDMRGRACVKFSVGGKRKSFYVSRLVAEAFLQNKGLYNCVCHKIESSPQDNSVGNLWWGTHKDNMRDMISKGRDNNVLKNKTGEILGKGFNKRSVVQLNKKGEVINVFETITSASRETGIGVASIINCCKGRKKSVKGYIFNYKIGLNEKQ